MDQRFKAGRTTTKDVALFIFLILLLVEVLALPVFSISNYAEENITGTIGNPSKPNISTPFGPTSDPGPADSDYPTDHEIRSAFIEPTGPYVFYSEVPNSTPAYRFAQSLGGQIPRDAYPKKFTSMNGPLA